MAWISVHEDVIGSKLRKLAQEVGCSQAEALGILNVIWLWGLKNAHQSGMLKYATRRNVAAAIPFDMLSEGLDPQGIVEALIATGWIDIVDDALFLHDWDEWQEQWYKFLDRKAYDAKRKRDKRKQEKEQERQKTSTKEPEPPRPAESEAAPMETPPAKKKPPKPKKPEPEKVEYAEFVHMQEAEYQKLIERFGQAAADKAVEILDNYKGANRKKKYDSDYRAILNWVIDRIREKHPGLIKRQENTQPDQNPYKEWGAGDG